MPDATQLLQQSWSGERLEKSYRLIHGCQLSVIAVLVFIGRVWNGAMNIHIVVVSVLHEGRGPN